MFSDLTSVGTWVVRALKAVESWSWVQLTLAGIAVVLVVDYLRTVYRPGLRHLPGPFWARYFRLWRAFFAWDGHYPMKLAKLHQKHGPLVRIGPYHVSIGDAQQIPIIYGFNTKYAKGPFYDCVGGNFQGSRLDNVFSIRDPNIHKKMRNQISTRYTPAAIKGLEPMMDDCTDDFIEITTRMAGQTIDFGQWLHWYAADVIGELTFQTRFGFMKEQRDIHGMILSMDIAAMYQTFIGQVPFLHGYLVGSDRFMNFINWLTPDSPQPIAEMFKVTMEQMKSNAERKEPKSRSDILDWLTENMKSGKHDMTELELFSHVSANLLGGSDTTSSSLRSIFYFLVKHPRVYNKLIEEIKAADASDQLSQRITYGEALKLDYLQAVIKESMRLLPAIGAQFEREVPAGGDMICGTKLPGGTIVGISAVVIHQDKSIYGDDADSFRPERWLECDEEQLKIMEKSFFTFGHGSRTCIGKNIGLTEVSKFVPRILRKFDVQWASDKPEWEEKTFWFATQKGFIARLHPREDTKKVESSTTYLVE